jgi:hypothetical protein
MYSISGRHDGAPGRVYNEKDRQTLEWLRRHVGDVAIASAVAQAANQSARRHPAGVTATHS